MIIDEMKATLLHAIFVNKDFIIGEDDCNYEKYLLELVNNSIYFREKSNFIEYKKPKSESKGECDCISPDYQMDFKLLASTTRLHASKEFTNQIQIICKGVTSQYSPRKPNSEMQATRLHAALREYSYENLFSVLSGNYEYGSIEYDIKKFVNLLNTKKNLFFFFPYQFTFQKHYSFKYALDSINIALSKDFKESNLFREKYCTGYDTFLAFIYDDNLVISKFEENGKLKIIDCIYLFKSKTYNNLYNYVN